MGRYAQSRRRGSAAPATALLDAPVYDTNFTVINGDGDLEGTQTSAAPAPATELLWQTNDNDAGWVTHGSTTLASPTIFLGEYFGHVEVRCAWAGLSDELLSDWSDVVPYDV